MGCCRKKKSYVLKEIVSLCVILHKYNISVDFLGNIRHLLAEVLNIKRGDNEMETNQMRNDGEARQE